MLSKQYICYYNDILIKSKLPKSIKGSLWLHPFVKKLITHHHKPNTSTDIKNLKQPKTHIQLRHSKNP